MILSSPANAPPQMNRMFVVSIWLNSWWGCFRLPCVGTPAVGPDVRLLHLDFLIFRPDLDPLVVVVDGDEQDLLRFLLSAHVLVEERVDLRRLGELVELELGGLGELLLDDLVAQIDALVADV